MSQLKLDQEGLEALAAEMASVLPGGIVINLKGQLGAGKTTFVRAFASARGCSIEATSPSYSLAHRYPGSRGDMWHLDCYRLRDPEEAADFDWAEMLAADALLIEWPERLGAWAPQPGRTITLEHDGESRRIVEVVQ